MDAILWDENLYMRLGKQTEIPLAQLMLPSTCILNSQCTCKPGIANLPLT